MSRQFLLVVALTVAVNTGMGIIIPVLPTFLKDYGFSTAGLSLPFFCLIVGRMVSKSFSGQIINWLSNKGTLIGCFALYTLVFVAYPYVSDGRMFLALRFLEGVVEGVSVVCLTDLAIALSTENRGKLMGYFGSAFGLGFIIGPMIGGVVFELMGTTAMFFSGAVIGALGLLGSLLVPATQAKPAAKAGWVRTVLSSLNYLPLYGPSLMRRVLFFSFMMVLPLYVTAELGLNAAKVALFFSGSAVISTALMPFTGRLADKMPAARIVLVSLALMGLLIAGFGLTRNVALFVVLFAAETLAFAFMLPAGTKVFADAVDRHPERGSVIGAFGALTEFVTLVLAVIVPPLYALSATTTWAALGALCLLAALPFLQPQPAAAALPTGK